MDNTFDHGANYTGIPNNGPDADPCDPESFGNIGGQRTHTYLERSNSK